MCLALLYRMYGHIHMPFFNCLPRLISPCILAVEKLKHREVTWPVNEGTMILIQASSLGSRGCWDRVQAYCMLCVLCSPAPAPGTLGAGYELNCQLQMAKTGNCSNYWSQSDRIQQRLTLNPSNWLNHERRRIPTARDPRKSRPRAALIEKCCGCFLGKLLGKQSSSN